MQQRPQNKDPKKGLCCFGLKYHECHQPNAGTRLGMVLKNSMRA